jgi:hypothetical protein
VAPQLPSQFLIAQAPSCQTSAENWLRHTFRERAIRVGHGSGVLAGSGSLIATIAAVSIKELLTVFFSHLARVCVDRVFRSGLRFGSRPEPQRVRPNAPAVGPFAAEAQPLRVAPVRHCGRRPGAAHPPAGAQVRVSQRRLRQEAASSYGSITLLSTNSQTPRHLRGNRRPLGLRAFPGPQSPQGIGRDRLVGHPDVGVHFETAPRCRTRSLGHAAPARPRSSRLFAAPLRRCGPCGLGLRR